MNGRVGSPARQDRLDVPSARRVAELEAENAALRRALAEAGPRAGRAADRHGADLSRERAGRVVDAAEARSTTLASDARHGREAEAEAGRADPAASERANDALRRANAELAAGRAALREREERLRLVLDSAADYAVFTTDLDRRVTSWNAGAERLLGWAEGEIVGRSADTIFTPEDRAAGAPDQEAAGALREGRAADERWHVRKDGSRFWASGLIMPLRDPEAGSGAPPSGLLKIMRDRTAERRAEEALREAEDHLRHTVELNPQIPWTADAEGRVTGFSDRWLAVTGLSREDALGEGWMRVPHPDDRARMASAWARAVSTGEPYDVEARLRMADGSHRWWRARAFPRRDAAGRVVRWYGTTEDVHGRRVAEETLRAGEARWRGLFERMREGFALCEMVYDAEGRAVDYRHLELNAAWGRLTGVSNEAVQGRLVSEAIPGIEPYWLETYARVVETGEPAHFEYHLAAFGRWFEVMAYRTEPGRFAAVFLNVTDRKAAEARRDALLELGDRLRDLRDPAEIAVTAAEVIGRALGAARAGYGTLDADEDGIRIERDWTAPGAASVAGGWRLSEFWPGFADSFRRGGVIAIADVARDPRTAPHAARFAAIGVRSCMHAPVVEAGRLAAVLFVHDAAPRNWSAEEVAFVRGAADRAWAAAERARAEAALAEGEARWRGLFERMHEGFALCEAVRGAGGGIADYRYLEVNAAWERLTGVPAAATAGRLATEVNPAIEPFWIETFARVVETGEAAHVEHQAAGLGGRWFEAMAYRTEPERFALLFLNVTGRKAAEAALRAEESRLRLALEAGRLGAWELDVAADAATRSPRHDAIFGYAEPPPGWGFEPFMRHVLPEDRARVERAFRAAVEGGAEDWHFECRIRRADGEERWIEGRGQPVRDAEGRPVRLLGVVADVTERKRAEERRALLVNELNHRVKNTLAVVQSLALQTARGAADLPSFSAAFQARLIALARAHDLLTQKDWEGAPLAEVARAALEGSGARADLDACASDALLAPAQALALAMALHELGTNALKHGALSAPSGRVAVACGTDPEDGAPVVEWTERGGPPVAGPPARRGFGLRLLERGLASQAGMAVDLRFETEGVRCVLRLPPPPIGVSAEAG